jgi:hypothetical protein
VTPDPVRAIANAVLYEGYVLWPYTRSALKNQRRWTFGGVYPPGWNAAHSDDRSAVRAECLCEGELDVRVRFLQIVRRQVELRGEPVDEAVAGGERHVSWDEATEREAAPGPIAIEAGSEREELGDGVAIVRSWRALAGRVELRRDGELASLTVANETPFDSGTREEALVRSFCSLHAVLRADAFVSATDPRSEVCDSDGLWPVLVEDGVMLASPIILEDHPKIAPESPGDLFDGGEIDQLLVLNILSLTDEEKAEMRATDPRTREILERTEGLSPEELMLLHGRLTDLSRVPR